MLIKTYLVYIMCIYCQLSIIVIMAGVVLQHHTMSLLTASMRSDDSKIPTSSEVWRNMAKRKSPIVDRSLLLMPNPSQLSYMLLTCWRRCCICRPYLLTSMHCIMMNQYSVQYSASSPALASPAMGHWGTCLPPAPARLTTIYFFSAL